jgi:hypothetical protein
VSSSEADSKRYPNDTQGHLSDLALAANISEQLFLIF